MSKHLEDALAKIRPIFEKAAARIDALKPGEKIPATKLADDLAKEVGMTGPSLYPTLKFLLDGYPGVDIRKGAHGGIFKTIPGAPVKGAKVTEVADDEVLDKEPQPIVNT